MDSRMDSLDLGLLDLLAVGNESDPGQRATEPMDHAVTKDLQI